jgi:KaiC/GvpD/RAD55 family RecA-like ATPase
VGHGVAGLEDCVMTPPATLFLIVGLPGEGKTTRARELEKAHRALRFSPNE